VSTIASRAGHEHGEVLRGRLLGHVHAHVRGLRRHQRDEHDGDAGLHDLPPHRVVHVGLHHRVRVLDPHVDLAREGGAPADHGPPQQLPQGEEHAPRLPHRAPELLHAAQHPPGLRARAGARRRDEPRAPGQGRAPAVRVALQRLLPQGREHPAHHEDREPALRPDLPAARAGRVGGLADDGVPGPRGAARQDLPQGLLLGRGLHPRVAESEEPATREHAHVRRAPLAAPGPLLRAAPGLPRAVLRRPHARNRAAIEHFDFDGPFAADVRAFDGRRARVRTRAASHARPGACDLLPRPGTRGGSCSMAASATSRRSRGAATTRASRSSGCRATRCRT